MRNTHDRGSALLVSMGFLALLFLFSAVFLNLGRHDQSETQSKTEQSQAQFLAQSGVEYAQEQLTNKMRKSGGEKLRNRGHVPRNFFLYGKSLTGDSSTIKDHEYRKEYPEPIQNPGLSNPIDEKNQSLENVKWASFTQDEDGNQTEMIFVNPSGGTSANLNQVGISNSVPSSVQGGKGTFTLKVVDTGGKLYINGPDESPDDPDQIDPLSRNRKRILNNLGKILENAAEVDIDLDGKKLGNQLSIARAQELEKNISNLRELTNARSTIFYDNQELVDKLKPYITAHKWTNPTTINPDAFDRPENSVPFLDDDHPGGNLMKKADENVLQPRPPVNVNTAPVEVLQSLFQGLKAKYRTRYFNEARGKNPAKLKKYHTPFKEEKSHPAGKGLRKKVAKQLAERIVSQRRRLFVKKNRGFANYRELINFIYALDSSEELQNLNMPAIDNPIGSFVSSNAANGYYHIAVQQMLVANLHPESRLASTIIPPKEMSVRFGDTTKADLMKWSTELNFSSNYYRVESLGRILGPEKERGGTIAHPVLARSKIRTTMKLFDYHRVSSQEEFVENQGAGSPGTSAGDTDSSTALIGPENLQDQDKPARWGGYLQLPTTDWNIELSDDENRKRYTYNEDFEHAGTGPSNHGTSLVEASVAKNLSELYPEGFFSHSSRYYGKNNGQYLKHTEMTKEWQFESAGAISMWVKPTYFGTEFARPGGDPYKTGRFLWGIGGDMDKGVKITGS